MQNTAKQNYPGSGAFYDKEKPIRKFAQTSQQPHNLSICFFCILMSYRLLSEESYRVNH